MLGVIDFTTFFDILLLIFGISGFLFGIWFSVMLEAHGEKLHTFFSGRFCKSYYGFLPFLSASGLEDIGLVLMATIVLFRIRNSNHPSYQLARLRLAFTVESKKFFANELCKNWAHLPLWIKQEVGLVAINDPLIIDSLKLTEKSAIFDLYSGAIIFGDLSLFKRAVGKLQLRLLSLACSELYDQGHRTMDDPKINSRLKYDQLAHISDMLQPHQLSCNGKLWLQSFTQEEARRLIIKNR